jgi:FixJ family two-component response regulator
MLTIECLGDWGIFLKATDEGKADATSQPNHTSETGFCACLPGFKMTASAGRSLYAVVEDEPFMAELVRDMLSSCDLGVEVFNLGADLFDSPRLLRFEAIVLDLSLPDMEGFDIMDKLAAIGSRSSIMVTSGHDSSIVLAAKIYGRGIGLNMLGALSKPFTRNELLSGLGLTA